MKRLMNGCRYKQEWTKTCTFVTNEPTWSDSDNHGLIIAASARANLSVCVLMKTSSRCKCADARFKNYFLKKERSDLSHSLILRPLLYPSIQMGTAWDERISLYWTWLNAVLMKAYADNSFFIMSLARLGISFSIADRETSSDFHHRCFGCVPRRVFGILVFILHFCSIKRRADRDVGHERLYLRLKIDVYD